MRSSGAVVVEGPKFCGKTTTALRYAKSSIRLNTAHSIELAKLETRNMLNGETPRVIDEWQTVPEIWNEVKAWIDEKPDFGQFILTGSSTPADKSKIYHSGAGRITTVKMRPMSLAESRDSKCTVSLGEFLKIPMLIYLMKTAIPALKRSHFIFAGAAGRFLFWLARTLHLM